MLYLNDADVLQPLRAELCPLIMWDRGVLVQFLLVAVPDVNKDLGLIGSWKERVNFC